MADMVLVLRLQLGANRSVFQTDVPARAPWHLGRSELFPAERTRTVPFSDFRV